MNVTLLAPICAQSLTALCALSPSTVYQYLIVTLLKSIALLPLFTTFNHGLIVFVVLLVSMFLYNTFICPPVAGLLLGVGVGATVTVGVGVGVGVAVGVGAVVTVGAGVGVGVTVGVGVIVVVGAGVVDAPDASITAQ